MSKRSLVVIFVGMSWGWTASAGEVAADGKMSIDLKNGENLVMLSEAAKLCERALSLIDASVGSGVEGQAHPFKSFVGAVPLALATKGTADLFAAARAKGEDENLDAFIDGVTLVSEGLNREMFMSGFAFRHGDCSHRDQFCANMRFNEDRFQIELKLIHESWAKLSPSSQWAVQIWIGKLLYKNSGKYDHTMNAKYEASLEKYLEVNRGRAQVEDLEQQYYQKLASTLLALMGVEASPNPPEAILKTTESVETKSFFRLLWNKRN